MLTTSTLLDGLIFPEGPRWRDGRLWFSDMHAHQVVTVDLRGRRETVVEVPGRPSGLGWLPDGTLLIVSMTDRRVLRFDGGKLEEHADLSSLAPFHCNDMVVDSNGNAYVGNFGFDLDAGDSPGPTNLILVTPTGEIREVASDLMFPNGSVITPNGRTLVVGESFAARLTAFDIEEDGSLSGRRLFASLEGAVPDGCCLDAEGAIWVASPIGSQVLRVREGGEVADRFEVDTAAIACTLGGPDRRTLFVLTAGGTNPEELKKKPTGRIEIVDVEVPGAGLP